LGTAGGSRIDIREKTRSKEGKLRGRRGRRLPIFSLEKGSGLTPRMRIKTEVSGRGVGRWEREKDVIQYQKTKRKGKGGMKWGEKAETRSKSSINDQDEIPQGDSS